MAAKYWVPGGTGDTASTTNWSLLSGGVSGAPIPTIADDIFFDSNSGSGTATVSVALACLTFTSTGSTNTLNTNFNIAVTVNGNITLGSGFTITGTGFFTVNAASTIVTNGATISQFTFGSAGTVTFSDDLHCTNCTFLNSPIINGHNIYISGNFVGSSAVPTGTTTFIMNGTGTISGLKLANPFIINTAGTITFSGINQWNNNGSSFTYTAGTIVTTGSTCTFVSCTVAAGSSCVFNNVVFNNTSNTITTDIYCNGNFNDGAGGFVIAGSFNIYVGGNLQVSNAGSGAASFIMNGTGTLSGRIDNSITINTSGTITFGSAISRASGTFKYTAGTVTVGSNTFTAVSGTITLDINGITLNNVTCPNNITMTLNSNLAIGGTLALSQSLTFNGTGNATVNTWTGINTGRVYQFQAGNTYTFTNSISLTASAGSHSQITSSSGSVKAIVTMTGGSQSLLYIDGIRIDSSGGATIKTFGGTLTSTINWTNGLSNFFMFN